MAEEKEFPEGTIGSIEDIKVFWENRVQSTLKEVAQTPSEELAEPLYCWEVFGLGPYQFAGTWPWSGPSFRPNRIIRVGEKAYIVTVVYLNPNFPAPPLISCCTTLTNFAAKIQLGYHTCNTQTCTPAEPSAMHIIQTKPGQCVYIDVLEFTPQQEACLYETNICARILNCRDAAVAPYAAFVRWVVDFDSDLFIGPASPHLSFDRPIRYMVYK